VLKLYVKSIFKKKRELNINWISVTYLFLSAGGCGSPKHNNDVIHVCTKIRCEFKKNVINLQCESKK